MSMLDQTRNLAHDLRLPGIHAALERRAAEALANQLPPLDFMRLILEDEQFHRKDALSKRLVGKAQFRYGADLVDWDQTYDREITKQKLKDLSCLSFYYNRENLLLYRKTGEGKTHMGIALGRRLCQEGVRTHFYSTNLLFEEVASEKASGRYLSFIGQMAKTNVIILDDFGLRNYKHDEATILLDILEARSQRGVTIVTSQVDSKGWRKLFDDPVIQEAIVDRLTKPSQTVVLTGGSYRDHLSATGTQKKLERNGKRN